ncbi:MAG: class I SAM-dependent methyltransferase [Steroidobacteraceae bacterium]|jgi:SAM-dependent methyltransferase
MTEMDAVKRHYSTEDLLERVQQALRTAGLDSGTLTAEQLEGLDQFHVRGLAATRDMAGNLQPTGMTVLDLGSGLGGPSRYLASAYGCSVEGVDLSPSFVEAASYLAARSGLGHKVSYRQADALALPFEDEHFDIVWTQHVAMNIADRGRLYAEAHRVLKRDGQLAVYDVLLGEEQPLIYPVPWARDSSTSYLLTPEKMRSVIERTGFETVSWIDRTDEAKDWFREAARRRRESPAEHRALGLHLAMGPDFRTMAENLRRNLEEGRASLVEAIFRRR